MIQIHIKPQTDLSTPQCTSITAPLYVLLLVFASSCSSVVAHHLLQVHSRVLRVGWLDGKRIHQLLDCIRGQEGRQARAQPAADEMSSTRLSHR
jgi:hypothetical protein